MIATARWGGILGMLLALGACVVVDDDPYGYGQGGYGYGQQGYYAPAPAYPPSYYGGGGYVYGRYGSWSNNGGGHYHHYNRSRPPVVVEKPVIRHPRGDDHRRKWPPDNVERGRRYDNDSHEGDRRRWARPAEQGHGQPNRRSRDPHDANERDRI